MELQPASFVLGGLCSAAAALLVHRLMTPGDKPSQQQSSEVAAHKAAPAEVAQQTSPGVSPTHRKERRSSADFLIDQAELTPADTAIICSYQLPIVVRRGEMGGFVIEWDHERGLNKLGMNLPTRLIYVGCISLDVTPDEEDELEATLLEQFGCVVVFLPRELKERYYSGFCRGYLSPILHNQMRVPRATDPFVEAEWRAYCQVNQLFASKVMEAYEPGYLTWVHDYHLLLLPSCILRKHRTANIGLFLHCPFPSSDVWRGIAVRDELLRAMLSTDLIGFLLFEYTRNFLTCCKRMLGLEYEFKRGGFLGIECGGRHVMMQVSTFGVSPALVTAHMQPAQAQSAAARIDGVRGALAKAGGARGPPVVVAGVDYLDRLKGVSLKLLAWETLLTQYPKYRHGHVMVQVCLGTRNQNGLAASPEIRAEIEGIASRINGTFPGSVHLEVVGDLGSAARLQLWQLADVYMCTAIREAVNIWPLEYVFCRDTASLPPGTLLLSEFTGFARVLNGALRVNPFSQTQLVEALDVALEMAPAERSARGRKDLMHVAANTMEEWARRFLVDLKAHTRKKNDEDFVSVGFGLRASVMVGMGSGFKALDVGDVAEGYQKAATRALLLDWGGTISEAGSSLYDRRDDTDHQVPADVIALLASLCADPANHVMILSGLGKDKVEAAFAAVPNLSLAAEHGFHFRIKGGAWQQLIPGVDTSWREVAASVMSVYASRTNGAFVMTKGSAIVWNFASCDPEYGAMQSREVQTTLQDVLAPFPVVVRTGKGYVEACLKEVNKGVMATRYVRMCADAKPLEFVLCAGDDSTDELMFAALHAEYGKASERPKLFTATVGRKPSEANAYVGDHTDVVELLGALDRRQ